MEPRDEAAENLLEGFIRGPGVDPDVSQWMNNSGDGDPELARRDGSGEGEANDSVEGKAYGADGADGAYEGDPELARRDGSGEGEAYNIGEGDDEGKPTAPMREKPMAPVEP